MTILSDWHRKQVKELQLDRSWVKAAFKAAKSSNGLALIEALSQCEMRGTLAVTFRQMARLVAVDPSIQRRVASWWQENGYRTDCTKNSDPKIIQGIRVLLPPYVGPEVRVFRGQEFPQLRMRNIGLWWTNRISVAEAYANDPCRNSGRASVILEATVQPSDIIFSASTTRYSNQYDVTEYMIDSRIIPIIRVRQVFL